MLMAMQRRLVWAPDELADRGADLGAPSRLALTRFQDRAKLEAVAQKMAVRLVDARDHLDDVATEACNPNVEPRVIQETQSKQWYRPMLRHQTKDGRFKSKKMQLSTQPVQSNDRDALSEAWLRQRDHTGRTPLPCKWNFPHCCEIEEAPHSWSTESLGAFRAYVEGRPMFAIGNSSELVEFAEHTSWLTLAADMQLATGVSLPISSGQQKGAGLLVAQSRTFEKCGDTCQISWRLVMSCL